MIYGEGMKMNDVYKVYIRRDDAERIIDVNSDAFLTETNDWTQIDEGVGDRYHHAQNNYFPKPPYDDNGIPRYAYVPNGSPKWRERTPEEMDADYVPPVSQPSAEELLNALMEGIADA